MNLIAGLSRRLFKCAKNQLWQHVHGPDILGKFHTPIFGDKRFQTYSRQTSEDSAIAADGLPLPPADLTMGYGGGDEYYQRSVGTTASIKSALGSRGIDIQGMHRCLDWGCATGRVIRGFADCADKVEFWGVDPDAKSIAWAKQHLSPPFRFATSTSIPHLPFPDGHFDFVYGISVFTHIADLIDFWLLELQRIMAEGGYLLVTVHDEASLDCFIERGRHPFWIPPEHDLEQLKKHDMVVFRRGGWEREFTIFRSDWLLQECARYFEVVDRFPRLELSQTGILLRKKVI